MKKTAKYIIGLIILVGFAFIYSHINKLHAIYNVDIDNSLYLNTGILYGETVEQEFTVQEEKLDGVQVKCATFGERVGVTIEYTLLEKESGTVVGEGVIAGATLKNNKFMKISLENVKNTKGKSYTLALRELGAKENDGVCFYLENSQKGTSYTIDGDKRDGTLILKTMSHRFDMETFLIMLFFEAYLLLFMKVMYKLFK